MCDFLSAAILFSQLISAPASEANLGQDNLRQQWSQTPAEGKAYDSFKKEHFLIDIAEDVYVSFLRSTPSATSTNELSSDIAASGFQARMIFAQSPWNATDVMTSTLRYFRNLMGRPFDAAVELETWWDCIVPPLYLALLLVLLLYFWTWAPALCKDFPKWFGSRSKILLFSLLASMLFWTVITGFWAGLGFILLCLGITYSREYLAFLIGAAAIALYFIASPFAQTAYSAWISLIPHEALELGRTRLEYSPQALSMMPQLEKVLWSDFNGDKRAAETWAEQMPPSKERRMLIAHFGENSLSPRELLADYKNILTEYGEDPVILFNLSELQIRTQQLIQAEEVKNRMDPQFYGRASRQTSLMNRLLLPPSTEPSYQQFSPRLREAWGSIFQSFGLSPFSSKGAFTIFKWLIPWLLIGLCWKRRSRASGVCEQTGEATLSPTQNYSSLYMTVTHKKDAASHALRQRLDLLSRRYAQIQSLQVKIWNVFFPGSYSLVFDQSPVIAYLKTALPVLFLWNALSIPVRTGLLVNMGQVHASFVFGAADFSYGFGALFLVSYLILFWNNLSRLNA